ncbi:hypothetical protein LEP1GSC048_3527 [Leptospira santarosai serovar Shermani str. 1342KT]|nr:hypothetical protein LEP1GSC048_3527 [Leptospira santarosai serovar Shermani str. 1342KT]
MSASITHQLRTKEASTSIVACTALRLGRNPKELLRKLASKIGSITILQACCTTRSRIVGIPSGRWLPSGLGIITLRTGEGRYFLLFKSSSNSGDGDLVFDWNTKFQIQTYPIILFSISSFTSTALFDSEKVYSGIFIPTSAPDLRLFNIQEIAKDFQEQIPRFISKLDGKVSKSDPLFSARDSDLHVSSNPTVKSAMLVSS